MRDGYDIGEIKGDGYLVVPISMARINKGQSPKEVYEIPHYFEKKLRTFSNDVVLLYTNGLYFNDEHLTYEKRTKMNEQIINHAAGLRKLIENRKEHVPPAFHFLPIDYIILNSPHFRDFFKTLKKAEQEDEEFRKCIEEDMDGREYTEANVNFILEEVAVAHIIRERLVEFPRTLVKNDIWRLIAYPGTYMRTDRYQWQHKILPQEDELNPFRAAHYDFNEKALHLFSQKTP